MRIGVDARLIHRSDLRGTGKYIYFILKHIKEIRSDYEFILYYEEDRRQDNIPDLDGYIRKNITIPKGSRLQLWEQMRLPFEVKKDNLELFHSAGETVPLWQPTKFIVTLHSTLMWERDKNAPIEPLFYYRKVLPYALKKAKKIITVSHQTKKDIIRLLKIPEERIIVIYNGIDKGFRKIEDKNKLLEVKNKNGIRDKYIFALGAEGPCKNTTKLIDTFFELKKEIRNDIQLVIAGIQDIAMPRFKRQVKTLGLSKDVILIGFLSEFLNSDLVCLYSGAELFIYPSLHESFGIPNIEAMACGTPVITSNVKAIPEITGGAALLVDPNDINDIAKKTFSVLNNLTLNRQLSEGGLKRARMFSWEKTAEETLEVYEEVHRMK